MSGDNVLRRILRRKAEEVTARARELGLRELSARAEDAPPVRDFEGALRSRIDAGRPGVIAEIKRASPSKGLIRADFDPPAIARSYAQHGAACLSVLTDRDFFQGDDQFLKEAREVVDLPVLRKDFIIDPYQVYETRVLGGDCLLLIVAALGATQLHELSALALELGLHVLVEVHDETELERALSTAATLVGINNRDLTTFETDLETSLTLAPRVDDERLVIAESGIHSPQDVTRLQAGGIQAFLVGEAFMRADDPGRRLADLFGI
ncbi:MAG: indole-3-glycerol phosphate synthase TrpC [Xanthomonadales bacterium]|nr:indole-3-glycerol phosphate synthase TrpC [Xanthomonadales bacterium]